MLLLLLPALDHWYFEVIFVARRTVYDCFRESSASDLADLKKNLVYVVARWFDIRQEEYAFLRVNSNLGLSKKTSRKISFKFLKFWSG